MRYISTYSFIEVNKKLLGAVFLSQKLAIKSFQDIILFVFPCYQCKSVLKASILYYSFCEKLPLGGCQYDIPTTLPPIFSRNSSGGINLIAV